MRSSLGGDEDQGAEVATVIIHIRIMAAARSGCPAVYGPGSAPFRRTVAKPLDNARRAWATLEYRPSLRPVTDGPGRLAHSYGSAGRRRPE